VSRILSPGYHPLRSSAHSPLPLLRNPREILIALLTGPLTVKLHTPIPIHLRSATAMGVGWRYHGDLASRWTHGRRRVRRRWVEERKVAVGIGVAECRGADGIEDGSNRVWVCNNDHASRKGGTSSEGRGEERAARERG